MRRQWPQDADVVLWCGDLYRYHGHLRRHTGLYGSFEGYETKAGCCFPEGYPMVPGSIPGRRRLRFICVNSWFVRSRAVLSRLLSLGHFAPDGSLRAALHRQPEFREELLLVHIILYRITIDYYHMIIEKTCFWSRDRFEAAGAFSTGP